MSLNNKNHEGNQLLFDWENSQQALTHIDTTMQLLASLIINDKMMWFNSGMDWVRFSVDFKHFEATDETPEHFHNLISNISVVGHDISHENTNYSLSKFNGTLEDYIGTVYLLKGFLDGNINKTGYIQE